MPTPNKSTIETVVADLNKYTKMASVDPSKIRDSQTRGDNSRALPGFYIRKKEAENKLVDLKIEYLNILKRGLGGIFLSATESQIKDFKKIAGDTAVFVEVDGLYQHLTDAVEPTMRKDRMFEPQNFAHLDTAIARFAAESEVSAPRLTYRRSKVVGTRDALVDYIRDTVRSADSDKTNMALVTKSITQQALERGFTGRSLPVVLTGATKYEMAAFKPLFSGRAVTAAFPVDHVVTQENVMDVFSELKKQFKKK